MGLHVLIAGHSILIDALNNGEQRPYAGIPLDMAQTIIRGGPPYERVGMMLISHHHEDHFDAGLVARFVLERPHVPVYSSPQVVDAVARLAPEMDSPISIKPKLMHTVSFSKGRLGVTAVALRHAGPQYADILNLAFIVEGSHSIIFAGMRWLWRPFPRSVVREYRGRGVFGPKSRWLALGSYTAENKLPLAPYWAQRMLFM